MVELNADDGMAKLLGKQNGGSNKDSADEVYESFEAFDSCAKTDGANISDYYLAFERANNKAVKHEMTLPTSVQAYKVLKGANIEVNERIVLSQSNS